MALISVQNRIEYDFLLFNVNNAAYNVFLNTYMEESFRHNLAFQKIVSFQFGEPKFTEK